MRPIWSLLECRLELERHEKGWRISAIGLPAVAALILILLLTFQ